MQSTINRAVGISLRSVCAEARIFGGTDLRVTSCCNQASACHPGDLFVAITDVDSDGHDDVQEAIRRGATGILAESLQPVSVPVCVVPDTREAFGRLCQQLAGNPTQTMQTVGVTGTHGKTSTSMLIASVLRAAGMQTGFTSTLLNSDSQESKAALRTTPSPPEMAQWLLRMRANQCSHAVIELSSRALAQRRAAGLEFDAAVITNLRRDHIDFHGTLANYRQAKARLLQQLKPQGFAVVNADDAGSQLLAKQLSCPVLTFGMRERAEIMGGIL